MRLSSFFDEVPPDRRMAMGRKSGAVLLEALTYHGIESSILRGGVVASFLRFPVFACAPLLVRF